MSAPAPADTTQAIAEVFLWGGEAILFLLTGYALFEWGALLLRRVQGGNCKAEKAKLLFGLPALAFALLPAVCAGYAVRLELFGLKPDMGRGVGMVLSLLFLGFVGEAVAIALFFRKLPKAEPAAKKEVAQKEMAGSAPEA